MARRKKRLDSDFLNPMEDEVSAVEERPSGDRPDTRARIGKVRGAAPDPLNQPGKRKKGTRKVPRATVGLRAASPNPNVGGKTQERRATVEEKVRETREEHRQKVWDKLDEARRRADERAERLRRFEPNRDDEYGDDDGFDF